jgi:tetratricopeptide (TPR) repeat protein
MDWNVWGAPIAVMTIGMVAGIFLALKSRGGSRHDPASEAWALKDSLIDQLRSLRADQAKIESAEYAYRWGSLVDEAATALKTAEEMEQAPTVLVAEKTEHRPVSWSRRAAWAGATMLFFVGLGAALQTSTSDRKQGGIMTGGILSDSPPMEAMIASLKAESEADPTLIDPINKLAHLAIQAGDLGLAMSWMDKARALAPDHPEVRTHLAILQTSVGMAERATAELDVALAADPNFSEAHLWRGLIALQTGNRSGAVSSLEKALENASSREERSMASRALAEARRPPATTKISGSMSLAEGSVAPTGGVLFIMVRRSAEGAGPPVAAVRLDPRGVPGTFTITDRDLMMGGAWPEQVWVEARLDADGDPTTKEASDLVAPRLGPFAAGTKDVGLELGGGAPQATVEATPQTSAAQIQGEIRLATGQAQPTTGAVFVIVRRSPTPQGPPVAAVRLNPSAVPGPFSVGDGDIMLGGPWPAQVWIQARADADGNAMTKEAGDASSPLIGPLSPGSLGVSLELGGSL